MIRSLSTRSQGITKTNGVIGGDTCIANTRIPVWLFVSLRTQGASDADLLKAYPHLTAADLVSSTSSTGQRATHSYSHIKLDTPGKDISPTCVDIYYLISNEFIELTKLIKDQFY